MIQAPATILRFYFIGISCMEMLYLESVPPTLPRSRPHDAPLYSRADRALAQHTARCHADLPTLVG